MTILTPLCLRLSAERLFTARGKITINPSQSKGDYNRPFAGSGHMVQNHTYWDASCAVGFPKQSKVPLSWKSHCATCVPVGVILYHVTGSCKGPIVNEIISFAALPEHNNYNSSKLTINTVYIKVIKERLKCIYEYGKEHKFSFFP